MMRATLIIAALSALTALPAAAGGEWPDGPNKQWFKGLQRPDNHKFPDRDADSMTCCGPGDVVKTRFRVDLASSAYPRDVWYALHSRRSDRPRSCAGWASSSVRDQYRRRA